MKLSDWRAKLVTWLTGKVTVDSWYLDSPAIGKTNAFIPPLRNVNYTVEDYNTVRGYGIQDVLIVRRYPRDLAYQDLPISSLEGLHSTVSLRLALEAEDIADLHRLEVLTVEDPLYVEETGDRNGDWIIRLHWAFSITWYAEPEAGTIGKPFTINEIDMSLYRQLLDESADTLDYRVTIKD